MEADAIEEAMSCNYPGYYEYYSDAEGHPTYIPLRVVEQLNFMHYDLVTELDVPFLVWFLETPEGCEKAAMSAWLEYFGPQRWLARREELAKNPHNERGWAIKETQPPDRLLGDWQKQGRWPIKK